MQSPSETRPHPNIAAPEVYPASRIKRRRATNAEMEARAEFLIGYAKAHGPVTVRQLYYQAEVAGLPGIAKTEAGYAKVQTQVLKLRREGRLSVNRHPIVTPYRRAKMTPGFIAAVPAGRADC